MCMCCVSVWRLPATALFALSCAGVLACAGGAHAEDERSILPDLSAFDLAGRADISSGFDASSRSWSAYSTAILSPLGPLHQDGLRLKLTGSYSAWSYDAKRTLPYCMMSKAEREQATGTNFAQLCDENADRALSEEEKAAINRSIKPYGLQFDGENMVSTTPHEVQRYDAAIMPGHQSSWGAVVVKAYLGPAMEQRTVLPADPLKASGLPSGISWGARGNIETWMRLSDAFWISADGSYFTGTDRYSSMLRLGYQPFDWLTLGPELTALGDREDDSARAGGFLRLTLGKTEATLSAGMSAEYDGTTAAYGSAAIYTRF